MGGWFSASSRRPPVSPVAYNWRSPSMTRWSNSGLASRRVLSAVIAEGVMPPIRWGRAGVADPAPP
jgi:hypothetical protein